MNLVKVEGFKDFYITPDGDIVKIKTAYLEPNNGNPRYVLVDNKKRKRIFPKKAKQMYKEAVGEYNNNYILRHELKDLGWSNKDIAKFIQKSKKFRVGEGYKIEQDIVDNRLVLVVRTDMRFGNWLEMVGAY